MLFRKLPAHGEFSVSERIVKLRDRLYKMMRRLVDYDCPGLFFKLLNDARAFLLSLGKNASNANLLVGLPDMVSAVMHAAAPGSEVTGTPSS